VSTDRCGPTSREDSRTTDWGRERERDRDKGRCRERERTEMKWARLLHPLSMRYLPGTDHVLPTPPTLID
jgi:hypothetical protein